VIVQASSFPIVLLEGTPRARGRQHGERFQRAIAAALVALRREHAAAAYVAARDKAQAAWPLILSQAPDVAAELQGIAEGSAAELTDVLLRVGFEFFDTSAPTGCTAIACKGPHGAIVGQNWDAPLEVADELALFMHVGPRGFEQAVIASVGGLGWVGCNRHGLALLNNDLMLRSRTPGLPSQIVRRIVLGEPGVQGALAAMRRLPHMAGRSYVLGDAAGEVAGVEVSAGRGVRVNQHAAPILHANHALHPDIKDDEDENALMKTYPSSRHRLEVLWRVASAASSVDDVVSALGNREGHPDSICKARSRIEQTQTAFSIIVDCGRRTRCMSARARPRGTHIVRCCYRHRSEEHGLDAGPKVPILFFI
jgi:isopenicillin-N N-acyltransferase-like protein